MKPMNKKRFFTKTTAFALSILVFCGILVQSSPQITQASTSTGNLQNIIDDLRKENQKYQDEIDNITGDISENKAAQTLVYNKLVNEQVIINNLNTQIHNKEQEIADKEVQINKAQDTIDLLDQKIKNNEASIADLDAENKQNLEYFGEILRSMYITENKDFVSILMNSTDWYDLFIRSELIKGVAEKNVEFMEDLKAAITELEQLNVDNKALIDENEENKALLETQKATLEAEKDVLKTQIEECEVVLANYQNQIDKYANFIYALDKDKNALKKKLDVNQAEIQKLEDEIKRQILESQLGHDYIQGAFLWPVDSKYNLITTSFGYDAWRGGNHYGIDIGNAGIGGANIYAVKSGTVIKVINDYIPGYSYGKYVVVDHGGGVTSLYAHCRSIYVTTGQQVSQGDVIAAVGTTGWSTGNHLHFEIRINGVAQNPLSRSYEFMNKPNLRFW